MRAVVATCYGGREVLKHSVFPVPEPAAGEVLIRNAFASVNFHDTYCRSGLYKAPRGATDFVLGLEGAGWVESAPPGSGFAAGDAVAYAQPHCGSYAEFTAAHRSMVVPVPEDVGVERAAAALVGGTTAHFLLLDAVAPPLEAGEWVVVHAAAGATGRLLVRLAKRRGLKVLATAGTEEKRRAALALGADHAASYEDFEEEVMRLSSSSFSSSSASFSSSSCCCWASFNPNNESTLGREMTRTL